jgi:CheY-like chemotaxis protein
LYVTKPVRRAELRSSIEKALTGIDRADADRLKSNEGWIPALSPAAGLSPPSPRLRILVAEDNLVNQRVASRILEKAGYSVTVAGNGVEALAAFDSHPFDLILMDVQMPEMGGFEATARIRERERDWHAHTPIIAMTAHAMTEDRQRCLEAGMDDYISKPARASTLIDLIEKYCRQPVAAPLVP